MQEIVGEFTRLACLLFLLAEQQRAGSETAITLRKYILKPLKYQGNQALQHSSVSWSLARNLVQIPILKSVST